MRKLMLILLALCLAAIPCLAEGTQNIDYDFGDFTMSFPEDTIGDVAEEIAENEVFFTIYQDYDESKPFLKNLNGTWNSTYQDLTQMDPTATAQQILNSVVVQFTSYGIAVSNPTLLMAALDEQDGKPALSIIYSTDLDYSATGTDLQMTLYTLQGIVSDESFGTYTFTISTDDIESAAPLMEIMDTITWND